MLALALIAPFFLILAVSPAQETGSATTIEMRQVLFRYSPDIQAEVRSLSGTLVSVRGGTTVNFDDPSSFEVRASSALITLSMAQLQALMNEYILRSPAAKMKDLKLRQQNSHLRISGVLKKGVPLPFEADAAISVTSDAKLEIDVQKFSGAKIPLKSVLDALGIDLEDLVKTGAGKGLSVSHDKLILDPETALPAPTLRGKLSDARLAEQKLVLTFGSKDDSSKASARRVPRGYMWLRGGSVRFGRQIMFDADIRMSDLVPEPLFDFYLKEYQKQLIAGYSKTTPRLGLQVYMPGYSRLATTKR